MRHQRLAVVSGAVAVSLISGLFAAIPASADTSSDQVLSDALTKIVDADPANAKELAKTASKVGAPDSAPAGQIQVSGQTVSVTIAIEPGADLESVVQEVQATGATVSATDASAAAMAAKATVDQLQALQSVPGIRSVQENVQPALTPMGNLQSDSTDKTGTTNDTCTLGYSFADDQLKTKLARTLGDGSGVTVGVMSDSYARSGSARTTAAQDVASGALPGTGNPCGDTTPVEVIADNASSSSLIDEGRAMAQLVHRIAPKAKILFATGFDGGEVGFANNIGKLVDAGANVIVDDLTLFAEPMFQAGPIDNAIASAKASGVQYFSSAGNETQKLTNGKSAGALDLSSYSMTSCPVSVKAADSGASCIKLGSDAAANYTLSSSSLSTVLQWNQPRYGVSTDFNLYLLNAANGAIVASSTGNNLTSGYPYEYAAVNGTGTLQLVIARRAGSTATPRVKVVMFGYGVTGAEFDTNTAGVTVDDTIMGHNGGPATISVAAATPGANGIEYFSSHGPVTHYWAPVSGSTPAAALSSPLVMNKPDLTANDGDCTSFFGSSSSVNTCGYQFYGTSAAAPAAAAVAALQRSANSGLNDSQIRSNLLASACPIPGVSALWQGVGIIDAYAALGGTNEPACAPKVISASAGKKSAKLTVAPVSRRGGAVTGYNVVCKSSAGTKSVTTSGAGTTVTVSGLTGNVRYSCVTRTKTASGLGASAAAVNVTPYDVPTGVKVAKLSKGSKKGQLVLVAAVSNNGGAKVTRYTAKCGTKTVRSSSSTITISGLKKKTRYTCTVTATNKWGTSLTSRQSAVVKTR